MEVWCSATGAWCRQGNKKEVSTRSRSDFRQSAMSLYRSKRLDGRLYGVLAPSPAFWVVITLADPSWPVLAELGGRPRPVVAVLCAALRWFARSRCAYIRTLKDARKSACR